MAERRIKGIEGGKEKGTIREFQGEMDANEAGKRRKEGGRRE